MLQIVTGICLSLVYVPSADEAYASLEYLNYSHQMGWFLRGMHVWGSHLMIACMSIHMLQVFLFGASKCRAGKQGHTGFFQKSRCQFIGAMNSSVAKPIDHRTQVRK